MSETITRAGPKHSDETQEAFSVRQARELGRLESRLRQCAQQKADLRAEVRLHIRQFAHGCEREQYTDTGDAWTLFERLYKLAGGELSQLVPNGDPYP